MIQERLAAIQRELKAPKGQFNAFGKYKYRSCEDILEAVKPLLGTATLTLSDTLEMIGDRYYIKAMATLTEGDQAVDVTAYAREAADRKGMDESQITGGTSSYARKYALNGLFLIDDCKDADTQDNTKETKKAAPVEQPKPSPPPPVSTDAEKDPLAEKATLKPGSPLHKKIEAMIHEAGIDRENFKEWLFNVGWIELKDDKPSLSTLSDKNAKYLVDKWGSACATYKKWKEKAEV